ncbi:hypothetical protein, partial [Streptomyces alkaliterrae]
GLTPAPNPLTYVVNPCALIDPLGLSPCEEGPKRGIVARLREKLFPPSAAEIADADMRSRRRPVRLGDLDGVRLPDYGDVLKTGMLQGLDDDTLLRAINDPDELGAVVTIVDDGDGPAVAQGNHRIAEALRRMRDASHPGITPSTEILVLW